MPPCGNFGLISLPSRSSKVDNDLIDLDSSINSSEITFRYNSTDYDDNIDIQSDTTDESKDDDCKVSKDSNKDNIELLSVFDILQAQTGIDIKS